MNQAETVSANGNPLQKRSNIWRMRWAASMRQGSLWSKRKVAPERSTMMLEKS